MATHDYVIDNSTGANVRTDINNVLQAILTNNSNSSAPSTTAAYMFWADTTANIVKIRNSANNAWINLFTTAGGIDVDAASNFNEDVTFTGASYNVVWDKSDNALEFADNAKATFGNSADLEIYHSGTHSIIKENGTGNLMIGSSAFQVTNVGISETMIYAEPDNGVNLYYDNSLKFKTTNSGAQLTGSLAFMSESTNISILDNGKAKFGNGDDLQIYHDGSNSYLTNTTGELKITDTSLIRVNTDDFRIYKGDSTELTFRAEGDGACTLYYDNSKKFETTSTGIALHGLSTGAGNSDLRYNSSTGQVTYDTSTILVKENIQKVPYGLDIVNQLQPKIYERTDDNNKIELGFIAEEIEKLIPEIVPKIKGLPVNVDYRKVCVVLTKAIQELSAKVAALEAA